MQKSRILNTAEINVLFVKANRFLSKDSVKKEKVKIKNEIKGQFIADGGKDGRVYIKNGELKHSDDEDDDISDD